MVSNISTRVFLIRHGDTAWSVAGKHTSFTDTPMSVEGENQVKETKQCFVGKDKLINPENVVKVYVSPKKRNRRTIEILQLGVQSQQSFINQETLETSITPILGSQGASSEAMIQTTPWLSEWNYGEYEGLTLREISRLRPENPEWIIWKEGCPGGETPEQVTSRLDQLVTEIRSTISKTVTEWPSGQSVPQMTPQARDVVCVGDGHILAALALRWAEQPLENGMRLLVEPSSVTVLAFESDDLNRPAISLGRRMVR